MASRERKRLDHSGRSRCRLAKSPEHRKSLALNLPDFFLKEPLVFSRDFGYYKRKTGGVLMAHPKMLRLRQHFARPRVDNIPQAVREALSKLNLGKFIKPGQTVALTAGSRGIANIPVVLKGVGPAF